MSAVECVDLGAESDDHSLTIRVCGLFAILAASAVGIWVPWFTKAKDLEAATFYGTVFAAGVVVATGFVHILPDGAEALTNPCLGFSQNFPWAETFAGGSVLLIFVLEYFLRQVLRRKLGLPAHHDAPGHAHGMLTEAGAVLSDQQAHKTTQKSREPHMMEDGMLPSPQEIDNQHKQRLVLAEHTVAAVTLEMGIVFHSVFVGIDFGITSDTSTARALMIALIFHQGFEGLALGAALVRADCGFRKFALLAAIFCLITPFGCAIGLGMGSSYNDNSKVALGFNGAFSSVSSGILIYNGLVDLVIPTFTYNTVLKGRLVPQLAAIICLFAGYCAMAVLAKWA